MNLNILKYISIIVLSSLVLLTCCTNEVNSLNHPLDNKETASTDSSKQIIVGTQVFTGKGYTINLPENWVMNEISEDQILFTGPKVGNATVGFYISRLPKGDKNYSIAAQKSLERQSKNQNYGTLEEKDISQPGFNAFMRRAHWFAEDIDMELFVREIYTQSDSHVFILSGSIPNTPDLKELDAVIISILNSFRFK